MIKCSFSVWQDYVANRCRAQVYVVQPQPWARHQWAVEQYRQLTQPLLSCEPLVADTCFSLDHSGFGPSLALQFIECGVVQLPFASKRASRPSAHHSVSREHRI